MNGSQQTYSGYTGRPAVSCQLDNGLTAREWFAVYTLPQNERSVLRQLEVRQIETFLPTYEVTKVWKNRQRVTLARPLFPAYLFVHADRRERVRVLESPGVLCIVGNSRGPLPLASTEIEYLRSDVCRHRVEPFVEIPVGSRVRVKCGPLQGVEGVLVNRKNSFRFVLTIQLINQSAALEIAPDDLEPILPADSGQGMRAGLPERAQ